jgi:hypothetical protein
MCRADLRGCIEGICGGASETSWGYIASSADPDVPEVLSKKRLEHFGHVTNGTLSGACVGHQLWCSPTVEHIMALTSNVGLLAEGGARYRIRLLHLGYDENMHGFVPRVLKSDAAGPEEAHTIFRSSQVQAWTVLTNMSWHMCK